MTLRVRFPLTTLAPLVLAACAGNAQMPASKTPPPEETSLDSKDAGEVTVPHALAYPATRREAIEETIFGTLVRDPYRWLENGKSDEVKAWAKAEDALTRSELAKVPEREAIEKRLHDLLYVPSVTAPVKYGKRYFFTRRDPSKEKAVVYWRDGKTGAEKILLDPNTWSQDGSVSLGGYQVSWDGTKVAYRKHANNSDEATMHVLDVASGKDSEVDVIEGAKYAAAAWTPKGDGFYYTYLPLLPANASEHDVADRPGRADVRFHKLGTKAAEDHVVHGSTGDAKTFLGTDLSKDGRWLFVYVQHGWNSSDVYFKDLSTDSTARDDGWRVLTEDTPSKYNVIAYKNKFYVGTNDGAPKSRVFVVDPAHARDRKTWKEIVPERHDATLDEIAIVGGKLSLRYLKDVLSHIELHDLEGKLVREIGLPEIGTASNLIGHEDDDEAYFSFTSFTYPTEIYETSVNTGKASRFFRLEVPVDPSKFVVEQIFFPSKDGTKVPMFVIHARDLKRDGSAPAILYGYGGFLVSQTPTFQSSIFPWIERGGVYAIANLRGGAEYGEDWHKGGMLHAKQNVFDDFVGAAEALVRAGFTKSDRLAARGGSNGGLLVGAAITQRPELFAVGLCGVPLLDMIRYDQFGSGKTWISEYGTASNEEDFKALYAYSPYHHVTRGTKYPAMLFLSADSDDRVDPLHARKFAAELQDASSGGPVLLRIEHNAGHGGADLQKANVIRIADEYAFAIANMKK